MSKFKQAMRIIHTLINSFSLSFNSLLAAACLMKIVVVVVVIMLFCNQGVIDGDYNVNFEEFSMKFL